MTREWQVGDIVQAEYKTGTYIGSIVEYNGMRKAAVKVLAVVKHPLQGDLHHREQANVAFFHQRRALAHREIALMSVDSFTSYEGEVPVYEQSLQRAITEEIAYWSNREDAYAERAAVELKALQLDYFPNR